MKRPNADVDVPYGAKADAVLLLQHCLRNQDFTRPTHSLGWYAALSGSYQLFVHHSTAVLSVGLQTIQMFTVPVDGRLSSKAVHIQVSLPHVNPCHATYTKPHPTYTKSHPTHIQPFPKRNKSALSSVFCVK